LLSSIFDFYYFYLNDVLQFYQFPYGCFPQAKLATQEVKLLSLDPMFRIELELLTGACGASGQTKLKELFMDILPNATKVVEIQSVIQKANVLQASKLWSMVGSQAHGLIKAAMRMLNDISQGEPPKLPCGACQWLVEVYARLPWLATTRNVARDKAGKTVTTTLRGKDAVLHAWKAIEDKGAAELSLQDPHCISVL